MRFLRDPRAYFEGLGTASLLVVGALIVLVTVSSLVGFSDWGVADRNDDVEDLVMKDPSDPLEPDALAAQAARAAAPGSGAGGADPGGLAGDRSGRPDDSGTRRRTGSGLRNGDLARPRNGLRPGPRGNPAPPAPVADGDGPIRGITRGLADTTEEATGDLGRTVSNVDSGFGGAVQRVGGAVGDALRGPGVL